MFKNHSYFLALAREKSVSEAARQLGVSHPCISRYLTRLEKECGVTLFQRKPVFSITPEGTRLLYALQQLDILENDLKKCINEKRYGDSGEIRLGTTEGRFRILMPDIITGFRALHPRVRILASQANSQELRRRLHNNDLDLIIVSEPSQDDPMEESLSLMEESLYVVLSDDMLEAYYPEEYPACLPVFRSEGIDLQYLAELNVPFCFNIPSYTSSRIMNRLMEQQHFRLNVAHVSSQPDLHHMMTARNYAASLCLSMYLPNLEMMNQEEGRLNRLHAFPVKNLEEKTSLFLKYRKERQFTNYAKDLIGFIREICLQYPSFEKKYLAGFPDSSGSPVLSSPEKKEV